METVSLVFGLTIAALGFGGLLGVTLVPRILSFWPYNTRAFVQTLARTQRSRAIVFFLIFGLGLYAALADSLPPPWNLVVLGGLFLLTLFVREPAGSGS